MNYNKDTSRCVVLVQLGTPDSLEKADISSYLDEFLMDPGTISRPFLIRYALVKWIIVPRRTSRVISRYKQIWDSEKGSPLAYHTKELASKLDRSGNETFHVKFGMLYGSPKVESVINQAIAEGFKDIILLPLFPHQTPATTGAVRRRIDRLLMKNKFDADFRWIPSFYAHTDFIQLFANRLIDKNPGDYNEILFSFHGLPMKQIHYKNESNGVSNYMEACERTARLIANKVGLTDGQYKVTYQSRFGRNWTSPQTEEVLAECAKEGKSTLLLSPSFTADCLETSWEVGISFQEKYSSLGGGEFDWVTSLNSDDDWVNVIFGWIQDKK